MVIRNEFFLVSKMCWMLYQSESIALTRSGARDGFTSNNAMRWRLLATTWWLTTEIVELATLRWVRKLVNGSCLEGGVPEHCSGLIMCILGLYVIERRCSTYGDKEI